MSAALSALKGFFSGDTLVIVIVFALFFAYSMFMGRGKIISLILSFYPAVLLYINFPFLTKLLVLQGDKLLALNRVAVFLIILILINIVLSRYIFSESQYIGSSHLLRNAGLSIGATILFLIFTYSVLNLDAFYNFSHQIDQLFAGADKIFYWNVAVLALLAIL